MTKTKPPHTTLKDAYEARMARIRLFSPVVGALVEAGFPTPDILGACHLGWLRLLPGDGRQWLMGARDRCLWIDGPYWADDTSRGCRFTLYNPDGSIRSRESRLTLNEFKAKVPELLAHLRECRPDLFKEAPDA